MFGAVENVRHTFRIAYRWEKKVFVSQFPLYHQAYFTKLKQTLLSGMACLVGGVWNCVFSQADWLIWMAKQVPLQWLCFYLQAEFGTCYVFCSWFRTIHGCNFSPAVWHKMKGGARAFHTQNCGVPDVHMFSLSSVQSRRTVWKWALYPCYSWRFGGSAAAVWFMFLHWFQQKLIHFTWAQMTSLHCLWRAVCWIWHQTEMYVPVFQTSFQFSI